MTDMIIAIVGCSKEEAEDAFHKYGNVLDAIDALSPQPVPVQGSKYFPPKPVVAHVHDDEQQSRCEAGQKLQDKVNAVISVAHSQMILPQPEVGVEFQPDVKEHSVALPTTTSSQPDSHD